MLEMMKRMHASCAVALLLWIAAGPLAAQAVYKCQSNGSVAYSHEPCLGAQVVDTTPTQGLDKSSGKSRKGADVINNEQNKAFAEALKPLTGMDAEQRETLHRRFKLPTDAKMECGRLDGILAAQQAAVRAAGKPAAAGAEASLLVTRRRFRDLRC